MSARDAILHGGFDAFAAAMSPEIVGEGYRNRREALEAVGL